MQYFPVADWDDAYANAEHIPRAQAFIDNWPGEANRFREKVSAAGRAEFDTAYGDGERNAYDLFLPEGDPAGLFMFVHGGYWMRFERHIWSHLAAGAIAHGFAAILPSYTLCPEVRISDITAEVAKALAAAANRVSGPIVLAGHSAGGHLVARMVCRDTPLEPSVQSRIVHTMPISPISDLRPLRRLKLNETLRLDENEAAAESPALLTPVEDMRVTCWVGGGERGEFIRQNALLANIWHGLGARTQEVRETDRHHFDIIDGLARSDSPISRTLFSDWPIIAR